MAGATWTPVYFGMIADGLDNHKDPDDCDQEAVENAKELKKVLKRVAKMTLEELPAAIESLLHNLRGKP